MRRGTRASTSSNLQAANWRIRICACAAQWTWKRGSRLIALLVACLLLNLIVVRVYINRDWGYNRVNVCITILSKIYFYFTAGIVDTMLKKREEQRLR